MLSDGPFAESPISGRAFVSLLSGSGAPFIDQVQSSDLTGNGRTDFVTPAQNVVAGSCLVLCFQHNNINGLTHIEDTAGNTYRLVAAVNDGVDRGIEMWICRNPAVLASNVVTAHSVVSLNYWTLTVAQYAGTISHYDVTGKTGTGTGAAIATASFNTAYASEYVFCFIEVGSGITTAGANFTFDTTNVLLESWAPTTTQTGAVGDATNSVSSPWLAIAASVKLASYINNFAYYKPVTIDHTQVGGSALLNYSVTIGRGVGPQSADADLRTVGNGGFVHSEYEIRPFADSGLTMPLDFELVAGTYVPATGAYEMHVAVPNISSTVDTVFYLAFGDASLTTNGSSTAAWRPRYSLVVHAPNGSTLTLADSTAAGIAITNHGLTAAAGNLDGGMGFNGTSAYASTTIAGYPGFPAGNTVRSVSAWVKPTDVTTLYNILLAYGTNATSQAFYVYIDPANSKVLAAAYFNSAPYSSSTIAANVWTHIAVTYDGTTIRYYKNGIADGTATFPSGTPNTTLLSSYIGTDMDVSVFSTGAEDELRLCNTVLSAGAILADYNAQKASSTFLVWGSKVPLGAVTYLFRAANLSGLQAGGPVFVNPLG